MTINPKENQKINYPRIKKSKLKKPKKSLSLTTTPYY